MFPADRPSVPLQSSATRSCQTGLRRCGRSLLRQAFHLDDFRSACPEFQTDKTHVTSIPFVAVVLVCRRPEKSMNAHCLSIHRMSSTCCTDIERLLEPSRPPQRDREELGSQCSRLTARSVGIDTSRLHDPLAPGVGSKSRRRAPRFHWRFDRTASRSSSPLSSEEALKSAMLKSQSYIVVGLCSRT